MKIDKVLSTFRFYARGEAHAVVVVDRKDSQARMEIGDVWLNVLVAVAIMACIMLPQFAFRVDEPSKEKKGN